MSRVNRNVPKKSVVKSRTRLILYDVVNGKIHTTYRIFMLVNVIVPKKSVTCSEFINKGVPEISVPCFAQKTGLFSQERGQNMMF